LPLFRPLKTLLGAKITKFILQILSFLSLYYSDWQNNRDLGQLTNVHKNFILFETTTLFPRPMKHCWALRWQKLKLTFKSLSFAFYATIEKQQDLGQLTNNVHKELYFVPKTTFIISTNLLSFRMAKAKFHFFANSLFCIL
jgi:hypothetical protein